MQFMVYRIVERVGEGVTDIKEGDHVIHLFIGECGDCASCKFEKTNLCEKINIVRNDVMEPRFSIRVKPIYHFMNTSTFSEFTVVDSKCVAIINPETPLDKACLFGCGITTGIWSPRSVHFMHVP